MASFTPAPKPQKAPRLAARMATRLLHKASLAKASKWKQARDYGRGESTETWPQFKVRIKRRDGNRCIMPKCETPRLGLTVHHLRSVGSGGTNTEENAATLCAWHHSAAHDGNLSREAIQAVLAETCGYWYEGET